MAPAVGGLHVSLWQLGGPKLLRGVEMEASRRGARPRLSPGVPLSMGSKQELGVGTGDVNKAQPNRRVPRLLLRAPYSTF
jgi:hypothetical protein